MAPFLFIGGVVFGYFVVLDRAVDFLLNFNDEQFNIQVRAREYYSFVVLTLMAMGLVFQVPLAILAVTRLGIMTPAQLRANAALRVSRDRGAGGAAADGRSGHDGARDGAADPVVRVEYRPGVPARPPRRQSRRRRSRAPRALPDLDTRNLSESIAF